MAYNVYAVAIVATLLLIVLRELVRRGVWRVTKQRVIATLAANVASYVLAAAVAFGVLAGHGITTGLRNVVQDAQPGSDAATKLRPGDVIVAVDGRDLRPAGSAAEWQPGSIEHEPSRSESLRDQVARKNGAAVTLTIERAGVASDVSVTPTRSTEGDAPRWLLGIKLRVEPIQSRDIGAVLGPAAVFPADYVRILAGQLGELFVGRDRADPGGPVRMVEEFQLPQRSFLVEVGLRWMRFAVLAMLVMFVVDILRILRIARRSARA